MNPLPAIILGLLSIWMACFVVIINLHFGKPMCPFSRAKAEGLMGISLPCKANPSSPFSPCLVFIYFILFCLQLKSEICHLRQSIYIGVLGCWTVIPIFLADQIHDDFLSRPVSSSIYHVESLQKSWPFVWWTNASLP